MRKDEEFCKIAFDTFLKQYYKGYEITWVRGDNPPDYYLQLKDVKYAVEVTSMWENIRINNENKSVLGFLITVQEFLKQLERQTIQEGILTGSYAVRYKPIDNFDKLKKGIAESIRVYLRSNRGLSSAPEEVLIGKGRLKWYIKKYHSEKNHLSGMTSDAKWEGEAKDNLCNLINDTLSIKARKLEGVQYPKILIIYNNYPWLDARDWKECLSKLSPIDNFHTIFLVSNQSDNFILHTIDRTWLNEVI